jgi:hypothetical protein
MLHSFAVPRSTGCLAGAFQPPIFGHIRFSWAMFFSKIEVRLGLAGEDAEAPWTPFGRFSQNYGVAWLFKPRINTASRIRPIRINDIMGY